MPNAKAHEDFVAFMVEYTAFLGQMRNDESDKLAALSSGELPRIERSIATSQANAKKLENFEAKRFKLQAAAGYEGQSFRQLIASIPAEEQERLWQLFTRFEKNVSEIKFFNDKSMAIARDNMVGIDPASVLPGRGGVKPNNPYERLREERNEQVNMLETKA